MGFVTIIGIDPGLAACGIAVIDPGAKRVLAAFTVRTDAGDRYDDRLSLLQGEIEAVVMSHLPRAIVVEDQRGAWAGKSREGLTNHRALLARDAQVVVGAVANAANIPLHTVTAAIVRRRLGIKRGATKDQAWRVVSAILSGAPERTSEHARDAVAIAWAGQFEARWRDDTKGAA